MPRRGKSASPPPPQRRSSPSVPRIQQPPPVRPSTTAVPTIRNQLKRTQTVAPNQSPGLMAQTAATAGGVAIGSVVGHALTDMMSGSDSSAATALDGKEITPETSNTEASGAGPCTIETEQFLSCAQGQTDLALCEGFNEALQQCKKQNKL
ncbi:coiled-coil-helix-coiled-coil-helix domain-containing protein 10, mitochondrial-like [Wyeomyia smithii]|uniref:coiled-coil-helix-coiled-coil-helix domain-containing protein 10, mitochondrial-like n=1 Tax=Wyeomyia smithii TaxID=174621 RepID=UPI002467CA32|nr:coiled-coil-helix-coiled-coil-helix domain-containing protein 10, mitochondrial-like [Wyeomyia smithii]